jgi:hypothetical protein
MYFRSKMEQKSYIVSKRSTLLDDPPSSGSFHPAGSGHTNLARYDSRIQDRQGQEYVGTTQRGSKSNLFNDIGWGDGNTASRHGFSPKWIAFGKGSGLHVSFPCLTAFRMHP